MASSVNETGITWSAAASISLNSTSRFDSDAVTLNAEDWDASIQLSADNSGTPASGDVVDVYVIWTNGDILGDSGDDYDTAEHGELLRRLDTFGTNTPGEDPARCTVPLAVSGKKGFKLSAVAAQGGTRAITFRARLVTHRPQ
jgi:hypothetical protein